MTPNPLIAELISHKWAMEEFALKAFFEQMTHWRSDAGNTSAAVVDKQKIIQIKNGIALIKISGVLLKSVPDWVRDWGIEATGYDEINDQLRSAMGNEEVTGIHLQVSSPGGVVDGLADTADAILAAREQKQVTATIEDLGASAAYWLSSQAEIIEAGRTTEVGSIGVYTVYADMTKRAEEMGIKVIVIKSGEHKGMGVPGAEITDVQIEAVQEIVDQIADSFISAVAAGRGKKKSQVREWATGRLWIAKTALEMGLIDKVTVNNVNQNIKGEQSMDEQIGTNEQTETEVRAKVEQEKAAEEKTKAQEEKMNKLAVEGVKLDERERLSRLKAAFPDDLEFALKAYEDGKNVQEAKAEYCEVLEKRLKEKTSTEAKGKVTGAAAIAGGATDEETSDDFIATAKELAKTEKIKLGAAYKRVAKEQPELYQAHVARLGLVRLEK